MALDAELLLADDVAIIAHGCGLSSLVLAISFSISLSLIGHREMTSACSGGLLVFPE
jgi:hypothetical protein